MLLNFKFLYFAIVAFQIFQFYLMKTPYKRGIIYVLDKYLTRWIYKLVFFVKQTNITFR